MMSEKINSSAATNESSLQAEVQPQEAPEELISPVPKPESRWRRFFRLALRWVVGLLIVFLLGVLATTLLFYRPTLERLNQLQAEHQQSVQRVAELEAEVARLSELERRNQALEKDLATANLDRKLLKILADVNAARFALSSGDAAGARLILSKAPAALKEIALLVSQDQRESVTAMQNRLDLALSEMERDAFAAQSDLGVLASNLAQLEEAVVSSP
jgi:cell division protein FtsB